MIMTSYQYSGTVLVKRPEEAHEINSEISKESFPLLKAKDSFLLNYKFCVRQIPGSTSPIPGSTSPLWGGLFRPEQGLFWEDKLRYR